MAIGANWAEIWAPVWADVWTQEAPEPPVEPERTQKPAGRKRPRRKLLVEINGRDIEVASAGEARELLDHARQITAKAIEKARTVRVARGIQRPRITTNAPELKQVVAEARQDIVSLFDALARDLEIASLMRKRFEEEDEEEEALIRFLM